MIKLLSMFFYLLKTIYIKIKCGKHARIDARQKFEGKTRIKVGKQGYLQMGKANYSKDGFYLNVEGNCEIGNNCFFNRNLSITCLDSIKIGDYVQMGNNIVIVDHDHDFRSGEVGKYISKQIVIGNHVWIGANSVLLQGTSIGDNSVIGAGSVVRGVVPANSILVQKRQNSIIEWRET